MPRMRARASPRHHLHLSLTLWTPDPPSRKPNLLSRVTLSSSLRGRKPRDHAAGACGTGGSGAWRAQASSPRASHPAAADGADAVELQAQPVGVVEHVRATGRQQRAQQQGQRGAARRTRGGRHDSHLALPGSLQQERSHCVGHMTLAPKEADPVAVMIEKGW